MGTTKIEWANKVWNPITGCSPISEGCRNCYAKRMANRLRGRYGYPADDPFRVTFHPDRLNEPLRWRKPSRIFVCSMSDLFHKENSFEVIGRIFAVMDAASWHTFIVLTKRPGRMKEYMDEGEPGIFPYKNVWLGVSVEDQATADERMPILLQIPAAVRWVSVEPMLDFVDPWLTEKRKGWVSHVPGKGIDWIVAGPENGPGVRPCPPGAIENLYEQCKASGVPFFDKRKNFLAREFPE